MERFETAESAHITQITNPILFAITLALDILILQMRPKKVLTGELSKDSHE
jgi:hypothetical protein